MKNTAEIKKYLSGVFGERLIGGMTVAVTDRERLIFTESFGALSIERPEIAPDEYSLYRIASITKIVTGLTILRLFEEGRLDLDLPIKEYAPKIEFLDPTVADGVTLRRLLSHTAGLPKEYTPVGPREESMAEAVLIESMPKVEFVSRPEEEKFLYSNWGIRLAAYVAERVTGKLYSELAREYVLAPIGMDHSFFDIRVAATYPISLPHIVEDGALRVRHDLQENAVRHAAGGLFSNADDLCRLARLILNDGVADGGERIVSATTVELMRTSRSSDGYGLTMRSFDGGDRLLYGHLGSAPPYALSLMTDQQSGYGVITLINTQEDDLRENIPKKIFEFLY